MLLPAAALKILAATAKDDIVYQFGASENTAVFYDGEILLTTRNVTGELPDFDTVTKLFAGQTSATLDADAFKSAAKSVSAVAGSGERIELIIADGEVTLKCASRDGNAGMSVPAEINGSAEPRYYPPKQLLGFAETLRGSVTLEVGKDGLLLMRHGHTRYVQVSIRNPAKAAA